MGKTICTGNMMDELYEVAKNVSANEKWELIEYDGEFSISRLHEGVVCSITVDMDNHELTREYISSDGEVLYEDHIDMDEGEDEVETFVDVKEDVDWDIENNGVLAKSL